MPTGYTAKLIEDGQTFREFALTCSRAFGACIHQRDEPLNTPPKKHGPSEYHIKAITDAKKRLAELSDMNNEQRFAYGEGLRNAAIDDATKYREREIEEESRLAQMAAQVKEWNPPTKDHIGLKDFMLEQLKISGHESYFAKRLEAAKKLTPVQCFADAFSAAERDVEYHLKSLAEETARSNERNEWIDKLYQSLPD